MPPPLSFRSGSKPVDRRDSATRRHSFGWNDNDLTAFIHHQLSNIVEQIVDFRMREIAILNPSGRSVNPSGNAPIGVHQQCRDPAVDGGLADRCELIGAESL